MLIVILSHLPELHELYMSPMVNVSNDLLFGLGTLQLLCITFKGEQKRGVLRKKVNKIDRSRELNSKNRKCSLRNGVLFQYKLLVLRIIAEGRVEV